ncbi:MAG: GspE/PulE family protein [Syntrophales bacterium]
MIRNPAFIKMAVAEKLLTDVDQERLSVKYRGDDFAILMHLVKGAVAHKEILGKLWGDSIGCSYVDLSKTIFQSQITQKMPEAIAKRNTIIPIYQFGGSITVAMSNPNNGDMKREMERLLMEPIFPVFSFPDDIEDAIVVQYQSSNDVSGLLGKIAESSLFKSTSKISTEQLKEIAGDQSIIQFTLGVVLLAMKERASDIHIEPGEDVVRIRFRIDGVLHERFKLDTALLAPLTTRLKVLANLDITERRRPQDGRISVPLAHRSIDMRFSSIATIYGEKIVLRILGMADMKDVADLQSLYFSKSSLDTLMKLIAHPNGVFFVTGPTGSGKTTTLYAAIKHLNKPGINIMTVEDPVEIRLPGINQVQVNHDIQFDFSAALRSFLRQDPDVILVGEIRDAETAKIAAQAALTGHLVFATMHTNNALQAITRLVDIGIEPFLVAPSIIGTMAQRLVRRLCPNCRERYKLTADEVDRLFIHDGTREVFFYRAAGCPQCNGTGYAGRVGIYELFIITDEIRSMVARGASIIEIQESARRSGFKPMHYDGIKKVIRGLTTLDEVTRVTVVEAE